MAAGAGYYDDNGVYKYGETDNIGLVSDLLNIGMDSVSNSITNLTSGILTAWTSWTPVVSNFTTGNGTVSGTYKQIGKTVIARGKFTAGSTTNLNGTPVVSLPVNSKLTSLVCIGTGGWVVSGAQYMAHVEVIGATGFAVYIVGTSGTYASRVGPAGMSFPSGSTFEFQIVYEAA